MVKLLMVDATTWKKCVHCLIFVRITQIHRLDSSGSRIWSRGGQLVGGPTLKREGCTPDFIQSYSLLGAKQHKNFGAGGARASEAPLDPLLLDASLYVNVPDIS